MQYLFADLFMVLPLVSALPTMEARPRLTKGKPEGNLVSVPVLSSVLGHAGIIVLGQLIQQWVMLLQPWCVWGSLGEWVTVCARPRFARDPS